MDTDFIDTKRPQTENVAVKTIEQYIEAYDNEVIHHTQSRQAVRSGVEIVKLMLERVKALEAKVGGKKAKKRTQKGDRLKGKVKSRKIM